MPSKFQVKIARKGPVFGSIGFVSARADHQFVAQRDDGPPGLLRQGCGNGRDGDGSTGNVQGRSDGSDKTGRGGNGSPGRNGGTGQSGSSGRQLPEKKRSPGRAGQAEQGALRGAARRGAHVGTVHEGQGVPANGEEAFGLG